MSDRDKKKICRWLLRELLLLAQAGSTKKEDTEHELIGLVEGVFYILHEIEISFEKRNEKK